MNEYFNRPRLKDRRQEMIQEMVKGFDGHFRVPEKVVIHSDLSNQPREYLSEWQTHNIYVIAKGKPSLKS
jgi:hypothetical protein